MFHGKPGPIQSAMEDAKVLDLFERINSVREFVDKFGAEPPWNPSLMPKYWVDPDADPNSQDFIDYDVVKRAKTGEYVMGSFSLPSAQAAAYNIPPEILPVELRGKMPVCPTPVRKLVAPEQLGAAPFSNTPVVINPLLQAKEQEKDPLVQILALLREIAKKVGV